MNREFFENYGRTLHEKITGLGASFKSTLDDPEELFLQNGYSRTEKVSIVERAVFFEWPDMPSSASEAVLSTMPRGNEIYVFERGEGASTL